ARSLKLFRNCRKAISYFSSQPRTHILTHATRSTASGSREDQIVTKSQYILARYASILVCLSFKIYCPQALLDISQVPSLTTGPAANKIQHSWFSHLLRRMYKKLYADGFSL